MNVASGAVGPNPNPAGTLLLPASPTERSRASRLSKSGRAVQLAPGIYAVGASLPPERVAQHHRLEIIATHWPGAILCDQTALAGGEPVDGYLFVCHPAPPRVNDLRLPGLTISPRVGPPPLPGDMPWPHGLHLSGPVRQLMENIPGRGRPPADKPARAAGLPAVEDKLEEEARTGGAGRIGAMLQELDLIKGSFSPAAAEKVRERLAALLGTHLGTPAQSTRLAARLEGEPFDQHRMSMLSALLERLAQTPPSPRPALGGPDRWEWEPFFEAYFSNFIEGTEFGVEEARRIAVDGVGSPTRPQDAHDVTATYRIVSDPQLRAEVPRTSADLIDLLEQRHATLMAARPDKRPGHFKEKQNYAGGYTFVSPEAVRGTLRQGFDLLAPVTDPFHRAVAMMLLLTEVHPFDDGNGRLARMMANAELSVAGQVRIVIPTNYRNDYLAGLIGVSNGAGQGQTLISVLDFAQRWTALVDWSSYERADAQMHEVSAYVDAGIAERTGARLKMPGPT
jgi:hypothetical protein